MLKDVESFLSSLFSPLGNFDERPPLLAIFLLGSIERGHSLECLDWHSSPAMCFDFTSCANPSLDLVPDLRLDARGGNTGSHFTAQLLPLIATFIAP